MGMIESTGQVIRSSGQATSRILEGSVQNSQAQAEQRRIKLERQEDRHEHLKRRHDMEIVQQLQEKSREVEKLKIQLRREENKSAVLRDLAADVVLDRSSLVGALNFLKSKWAKTPEQTTEFEEDSATARKQEKVMIEKDNDRQNKAYALIDEVAASWSNPESVRRRRQPKPKAQPPALK